MKTDSSSTSPPPQADKSFWRRHTESIFWTLVVVLLLRAFVVQAYVIPSESMEQTLLPGDFLLVAKFVYGLQIPYTPYKILGFHRPGRGDVVVFNYPLNLRRDFVKRCVAVAGDTVEVRHKRLYVNGKPVQEPYVQHTDPREFPPVYMEMDDGMQRRYQQAWEHRRFLEDPRVRDNFGPVVVPRGTIFVMGDNRDNSSDSRFWGPLPLNLVKGKPLIIYFSWDPHGPWWKLWERIRWRRMFRLLWNI